MPSFDYVIVPNYGHEYYDQYAEGIYPQSELFPLLNNPLLFNMVYENNEYRVFKRVFTNVNYIGFVDIGLTDNKTETSILGIVQEGRNFQSFPDLKIVFDFGCKSIQMSNINVSITYNYDNNSFTLMKSYNNNTNLNGLFLLSLGTLSVPLLNCFSQLGISDI